MTIFLGYESVPVPLGFDDWLSFWFVLVVSVVNGLLMLFLGYKFLQVLQLSGYKIKDYWAWLKSSRYKYWGRLGVLSFLSSASLLVTNVLLEQFFVVRYLTYAGLIFYLLFCLIFIRNMFDMPQKTPLKYTKRMTRLCIVLAVLVAFFTFVVMTASTNYIPYFDYGAVGLTPLFLPLLVTLAHLIMVPIENLISQRYICLAKKKIMQRKDLICIGVTGSYGKTTVKNILCTMLSEKYNVCATPYSYNTPLGLSKTILNYLKADNEIFVAEMGAKRLGDIAYLCKMVNPKIGVITGIGNQHLATFGNKENLKKTKFELVEGITKGGEVYFNVDGDGACELYEKTSIRKYCTTINSESGQFFVSDVVVNERGNSFKLHLGSEVVDCETSLLGKHNISNILLCASVAYNLGVSADSIKLAISKLVPSAHRLAIVPSTNALVVIDDAYNGSVEGARAALDAISNFKSKKIVVTPGLVELGKEEFNSNFELGREMAKVCDYVIIVGINNYDALSSGLEFGGFNPDNVLRAGSLGQAIDVLNTVARPGDVVLFENDLPDNYT